MLFNFSFHLPFVFSSLSRKYSFVAIVVGTYSRDREWNFARTSHPMIRIRHFFFHKSSSTDAVVRVDDPKRERYTNRRSSRSTRYRKRNPIIRRQVRRGGGGGGWDKLYLLDARRFSRVRARCIHANAPASAPLTTSERPSA